jgi:hypothetical protein
MAAVAQSPTLTTDSAAGREPAHRREFHPASHLPSKGIQDRDQALTADAGVLTTVSTGTGPRWERAVHGPQARCWSCVFR